MVALAMAETSCLSHEEKLMKKKTIYAISDIHGYYDALCRALDKVDLAGDNILVLLGDYIDGGPNSIEVLEKVIELQKRYGKDKVIALKGNHEQSFLYWIEDLGKDEKYAEADWIKLAKEREKTEWIRNLRTFYETEDHIFVHAGIDEKAGEEWYWSTSDDMAVSKYPWTVGPFLKTVVAGHISTATIAGNPDFTGIYRDGQSHIYIDGDVAENGYLPVLKISEA